MDFFSAYKLLADISGFYVLLPIVIGVWSNRRSHKLKTVIIFYLLLSLIIEIFISKLSDDGIKIAKYVELVLVCAMYITSGLFANKTKRIVIGLMLFSFLLLVTELLLKWDSWFESAAHCTIIGLGLLSFYRMLLSTEEDASKLHPFFWFNCALLVYFSSTFLLFLSDNTTLSDADSGLLLWGLHNIVNIIYYSILTYGFWSTK